MNIYQAVADHLSTITDFDTLVEEINHLRSTINGLSPFKDHPVDYVESPNP